jgi:hypothetical protein
VHLEFGGDIALGGGDCALVGGDCALVVKLRLQPLYLQPLSGGAQVQNRKQSLKGFHHVWVQVLKASAGGFSGLTRAGVNNPGSICTAPP